LFDLDRLKAKLTHLDLVQTNLSHRGTIKKSVHAFIEFIKCVFYKREERNTIIVNIISS